MNLEPSVEKDILVVHTIGCSIYSQRMGSRIGGYTKTYDEWLSLTDEEAIELGVNPNHIEFYRDILRLHQKYFNVMK
jgi:hypothetical protein